MLTVEQVNPVVRPLLTTCSWFSRPAVSASPGAGRGRCGGQHAIDRWSQLQDRAGSVDCGRGRSQRRIHVGLPALEGHHVAQSPNCAPSLRIAVQIDQRGLHDSVAGARLV